MEATRSATQKLPVATRTVVPTKAPSMNSSPWAKFTTSMIPKIRVSPDATSAKIMPLTSPFTSWTTSASRSGIPLDSRPHERRRGRRAGSCSGAPNHSR